MNRNHLWKLVFILLVLIWSISEIYPPRGYDLIEQFRKRGTSQDARFREIADKAAAAQKARPDRPYQNLQEAIGTNDITPYFRVFEPGKEAHPTTYILNRLQREAAGKIKLGLDLQGGTAFLVELDTNRLASIETHTNQVGVVISVTNAAGKADVAGALDQAVEVLRKRVDRFGVAEPVIQPQGNNRVLIQLPGLSEAVKEEALKTIQKVAFLEFRLVHDDSAELAPKGITRPGYEILSEVRTLPNGTKQIEKYLVKKRAEMQGGIKNAGVTRNQIGRPQIAFTLDSQNKQRFADLTTKYAPQGNKYTYLAIVLDGELQTAPRINSPITGGSGEITGDYTDQQAWSLANVLQNPLKTPVRVMSQNDVDPLLGKDSIRSGIKASIIGLIAVSAFMLVYYLLAGMVANVALICNVIILLGVMCSFGTTLTLPGIAGVVLTVGMAVDANVLIFERIREETAKGKSLRGALHAGYARAFGTIFDSHVTTLISSIILIVMGTGPVKGFGICLTIGVAASLFTALVVTRLIFDWLISKNIVKSLPMLHMIRTTKINFMRWAVPAFVVSWLIIIIGNSYGIFGRGHEVLGVEFSGGEAITLAVDPDHRPAVEDIRRVASKVSGGEMLVAYQRNPSTGLYTLRVTARDSGKGEVVVGDKIFNELKGAFPEAKFGDKPIMTERVGAAVGREIQETAILASLLALFGILVYVAFRYEFSFAVAAVIAIIHDVLMTFGCYFLAGKELNSTTVAAILTIIGFSINDTIVIFDRIREDLKMGVRGSFRELINQALNQTLSRTIITSGTVFLATLSLLIFGGGPINDFAFTFLVGIITGTYSSIYIASSIVLWWHKGHRPKIGSAQLIVEAEPSPVRR